MTVLPGVLIAIAVLCIVRTIFPKLGTGLAVLITILVIVLTTAVTIAVILA